MALEFSPQIFEKSSNIKFHENPSSGTPVVPCGRTNTIKLTVVFRIFVKEPTNNFLDSFSVNHQISSFMKIHPVGAELFHSDGQT